MPNLNYEAIQTQNANINIVSGKQNNMQQTKSIMGMRITIDIVDTTATEKDIQEIFSYFIAIDARFSPYKKTSEVSRINDGKLKPKSLSKLSLWPACNG